jgi:hypothetical protein
MAAKHKIVLWPHIVCILYLDGKNIYIFEFSAAIFAGDLAYMYMYVFVWFEMRKIPKIPTKINTCNQIDIF